MSVLDDPVLYCVQELLDLATPTLEAAGRTTPRLDAEVLLGHCIRRDRTWLYMHPEAEVSERAAELFGELLKRRRRGEPVAYLLGRREFYGRCFEVTPACLIPRPDTEALVEAALAVRPRRAIDVGTGSGIIACTLAAELPSAEVWATDISPDALQVARRNAERLQADVCFRQGDLLAGVAGPFDLVVSNPPYVTEAEFTELMVGVRDYEPRTALVAGPSGLEVYERLIPQALQALQSGGWLMVEMGAWQGEAVSALFSGAGLTDVQVLPDLAGLPRVTRGRRP
ncbi:MAG: peptide chain release factor N(5)-glutamine methyltransferase [Candidatus Xenobia bacterium]